MSYIGRTPTNAALTASDLADGIVGTAKIAADAVTDAKIADDVVGTEHLTANEVDTAALKGDAVTGAELADNAVNSEHYTDGSIDTVHLADGQVTIGKLATAVLTGATDIGAAIVDADLFLIDDGAGGTLRKTTAARIKTYAGASGDITAIDSLFKADIKIGEDDQTKIDFETADQINFYAANANQVKLNDGVLAPVADSDVDLGTSSLFFKDAFIDHAKTKETTITNTNATLNLTGSTSSFINFGDGDDVDVNQIKFAHGGNTMELKTSTKARIIIDGNGGVRIAGEGNPNVNGGLGAASDLGALMIGQSGGFLHQSTNGNHYFNFRGASGANVSFLFRYGGSTKGSIVWNASNTAFNTSSDYRLKENVDYTWDATTKLKQLKPARFNWISDETNTLIDGFLAHEAATVIPNAVTGEKDAIEVYTEEMVNGGQVPAGKSVGDNVLDDGGNTTVKPQTIDHSKIVPLLTKAMQELEARITALEDA